MSVDQIFDSNVRSAGDLAGIFEYDDAAGYFYLYETSADQGHKVVGAIRLLTSIPDFEQGDVEVRWDGNERYVGFFIRGQLWAAFDGMTKARFGGDYRPDGQAEIPTEIINAYESK